MIYVSRLKMRVLYGKIDEIALQTLATLERSTMHRLYIFSSIIFCISTVQCAEQCIIKSVHEQVSDILFVHQLSRFSHEDLMAFGLTCKSNDNYLRVTAEKRKQYLISRVSPKTTYSYFQWHRHGSRADCKKIVDDLFSTTTKKTLILGRLELLDDERISEYTGVWNNFKAELSFMPTPFYNSITQLCFIGYGFSALKGVRCETQVGHIISYNASHTIHKGFSREGKELESIVRCGLEFQNKNAIIAHRMLILMLNFPYLLKAILNSTKAKKLQEIVAKGSKKCLKQYYMYELAGVTLPGNYKECVPRDTASYTSFSELPGDLKFALEKRYEEQQQK